MVAGEFWRIGAFWLLDEQIIPEGLGPSRIYRNIEEALDNLGYRGELSILFYKKMSDSTCTFDLKKRGELLIRQYGDSSNDVDSLVPIRWDDYERAAASDKFPNAASWTYRETSFKMMLDMLFYALNNPALNLMVIQNAMTKVLASVLKAFKSRNYNVLIAGPSFEVVQGFCVNRVELGMPILQCGSMQRVRDTSVDRGRPNVAGTCISWDVEDYPIPDGLCPDLIFETIGSALAKKDYRGDVLILAYGDKQTFPDELPDSRVRSSFVPDGEEPERSFTMLLDMLFWALDNPVEHMEPPSLMVLSKGILAEKEFASSVVDLKSRGYKLYILEPVQLRSGKLLTTESPIWLWTSLLDAAKPIDQSGSSQSVCNKRKREAEFEED